MDSAEDLYNPQDAISANTASLNNRQLSSVYMIKHVYRNGDQNCKIMHSKLVDICMNEGKCIYL